MRRAVFFILTFFSSIVLVGGSAHASGGVFCESALNPSLRIETLEGSIQIDDPEAIAIWRDQVEIHAAMKLKGADKIAKLKELTSQSPRSVFEKALVFANYAMAFAIAVKISVLYGHDPSGLLYLPSAVAGSLFGADAISFVFHRFLDDWASEKNSFWGGSARAFRMHHILPSNLNDLSYLENTAAFGKLLAPLYAAGTAASLMAPHGSPSLEASALMMLMLFSNGTEIHRQAHLPQPNPIVQPFQGRGLLSREDHNDHHTKPNDSDHGIINGLSNRLLNPLGDRWDRFMWKVARKMPNSWLQNPKAIPDEVVEQVLNEFAKTSPNSLQKLLVSLSDPKKYDARLGSIFKMWRERYDDDSGAPGTDAQISNSPAVEGSHE